LERIESLRGLDIDGVVLTTPFYLTSTQAELLEFFSRIAEMSPFPVYLYDLWVVTQTKIDVETVFTLMSNDNIKGIKSGDLLTCKQLQFDERRKNGFEVMFSGLDAFDIAYAYGVRSNLDGMFSCTPSINTKMYDILREGDIDGGRKHLADILELRNTFISIGVMKGFTVAMNLLGYQGSFAPDYVVPATEKETETVKACMGRIGIL
jgi:dihydrodipicolinate synthase/N-acetylneuraminate lyase